MTILIGGAWVGDEEKCWNSGQNKAYTLMNVLFITIAEWKGLALYQILKMTQKHCLTKNGKYVWIGTKSVHNWCKVVEIEKVMVHETMK